MHKSHIFRFFIFSFCFVYSSILESNVTDLFEQYSRCAREGTLAQVRQKRDLLRDNIKAQKTSVKPALEAHIRIIYIKALLSKGQLDSAFDYIYDCAADLFPELRDLSKESCAGERMMRECLKNPAPYLDEEADLDAHSVFELGYCLSRYYFFMDQLEKAENLLLAQANILKNADELPCHFYLNNRDIKVNLYKQLGDILNEGDRGDEAVKAYLNAISFYDVGEISPEKGFVLLGLSNCFRKYDDPQFAYNFFHLALPHFDNNKSAYGQAKSALLKSQIELRYGLSNASTWENITAAQDYFTQIQDLHHLGLTMKLSYDMQEALEGRGQESLARNAADLAQKKCLPLLARLISGLVYVPSSEESGDDEDEESEGEDPEQTRIYSDTPPEAGGMSQDFRVIPATPSPAMDPQ